MADHAPTGPGYGDNVIQLASKRSLKDGDGGGTFDGMTERLVKLETQMTGVLSEIVELRKDVRELRADAKVDFRLLFGCLIIVALGLAGLMAKGFKWL